jgi:hypothetical protein
MGPSLGQVATTQFEVVIITMLNLEVRHHVLVANCCIEI